MSQPLFRGQVLWIKILAKQKSTVKLVCPKCKAELTVLQSTADKPRDCWRCSTRLVIPDPDEAPPLLDVQLPSETDSLNVPGLDLKSDESAPLSPITQQSSDRSDGAANDDAVEVEFAQPEKQNQPSDSVDASPKQDSQNDANQPVAKSDSSKIEDPTKFADVDLDDLIDIPETEQMPSVSLANEQKEIDLEDKLNSGELKISGVEPPTGADILNAGWSGKPSSDQTPTEGDSTSNDTDDPIIDLTDDEFESIKIEGLDDEVGNPNQLAKEELDYLDGQADSGEANSKSERQFRFDCMICGSMTYSTESQIGTDKLCPDCDSVMTVPVPTENMFVAEEKKSKNFLDDIGDADLKLSDPVEIPKFELDMNQELSDSELDASDPPPFNSDQISSLKNELKEELREEIKTEIKKEIPVVAPGSEKRNTRNESDSKEMDDELSFLDGPSKSKKQNKSSRSADSLDSKGKSKEKANVKSESKKQKPSGSKEGSKSKEDSNDDSYNLLEPVEQPKTKNTPQQKSEKGLSRKEALEKANKAKQTPKSKKGTLPEPDPVLPANLIDESKWFSEMMSFLVSIDIAVRWLLLTVLAAVASYLFFLTQAFMSSDKQLHNMLGFFMNIPTLILCAIVLFFLSIVGSSIVESTSQGKRIVDDWIEFGLVEWFGRALFFVGSLALGILPGVVIGMPILCSGASAYPLIGLSFLAVTFLFPIFLASMLENGAPYRPYSPKIVETFNTARNLWQSFYGQSIVLLLVASPFILMGLFPYFLVNLISAAGLTLLAMIYFRLLGYHYFRLYEFFKTELSSADTTTSSK